MGGSTRAQNVWETAGGNDFLQLVTQNGAVVGGINSGGAAYGALLPPVTSSVAIIHLTASQILNLSTTPVQILPSPGANGAYLMMAALARYNAGAIGFTSAGNITIGNIEFPAGFLNFPVTGFMDQSASGDLVTTPSAIGGNFSSSLLSFFGRSMTISATNPISNGSTGSLDVAIFYSTIFM